MGTGSSSVHHGYRLDLHEAALVVVVKALDLEEGDGGVVLAEELAIDGAHLLDARLVGRLVENEDGQLDDVVELPRAGEEHRLEILADLSELGDEVAAADELAVLVERHLPGDVEGLASLDFDAVRIADGLGEAGRVHRLHELGHGVSSELSGERRTADELSGSSGRDYTTRASCPAPSRR